MQNNVKNLSIAIPAEHSNFTVFSQPKNIASGHLTPYPAHLSPINSDDVEMTDDESDDEEYYEEFDDESEEETSSEYLPSEYLSESDPQTPTMWYHPRRTPDWYDPYGAPEVRGPKLWYHHSRRAAITGKEVSEIAYSLTRSLFELQSRLSHELPIVDYRGMSPDLSYCSTPVADVAHSTKFHEDFEDPVDQPAAPEYLTRIVSPPSAYDDVFAEVADSGQDLDNVSNLAELRPTPTSGEYVFGEGEGSPTPTLTGKKQSNPDGHVNELRQDESLIDPYNVPLNAFCADLPICNVAPESEEYGFAFHTLANSGVNFLTDYPVVNSPRMGPFEIRHALNGHHPYGLFMESKLVGEVLEWPMQLCKVRTREILFVPFSYTDKWQPRTELARLTEPEELSPRSMPRFGFV